MCIYSVGMDQTNFEGPKIRLRLDCMQDPSAGHEEERGRVQRAQRDSRRNIKPHRLQPRQEGNLKGEYVFLFRCGFFHCP